MIKKAIILSAGKGVRMEEATENLPKVMLKLAGKPLLQYNIELLKKHGVEDICINLHHFPEKIKGFLEDGSGFGVKVHYNYEPELLGTSGSLLAFKKILNEDFFVIYGDVIGEVDLKKWVSFHKEKKSDATLIVHKSSHPEDSDIVQINENGKITRLINKPGNRDYGILGSAAWYIVSPKVFNYLSEGNSDFIRDIFPKMIKDGSDLYGYNTDELLGDVGTPKRFKKMEAHFVK